MGHCMSERDKRYAECHSCAFSALFYYLRIDIFWYRNILYEGKSKASQAAKNRVKHQLLHNDD